MNIIFKVLCVVGILSSIVSAYDWTDVDFNNELHSDLLDDDFVEDDVIPVNYRVTRAISSTDKPKDLPECVTPQNSSQGGWGHNRYQRACCGDRDDLKMHGEALKDLRKECFAELEKTRKARSDAITKDKEDTPMDPFNCEKVSRMKDDIVCIMECVARKKKMVDEGGNLLRENVTSFVKSELVTKDWQKEIIDNVLTKCLEQTTADSNNITAKAPAKAPAKSEKEENKCNPSSLKFSHCLWREMQLSCPKDLIRNSKSCERMRERLQKKEYPDFERRGRPRHRNTKNPDSKKENVD